MQEIQEAWVPTLGGEDPLEEGMAALSGIPAQSIPCTEEPGGLQPMGLQSWIQLTAHTHQGKGAQGWQ